MADAETKPKVVRRPRRKKAEAAAERTSKLGVLWMTKAQVAQALGMSPHTLDQRYRHMIPDEHIDSTTRPHRYDSRCMGAILKYVQRDLKRPATEKPSEPSALDRHRMAQARVAEMELASKRGDLIRKDAVLAMLERWVTTMQRFAGHFRQTGDNAVVELYNEMVAEASDASKQAASDINDAAESVW